LIKRSTLYNVFLWGKNNIKDGLEKLTGRAV